VYVLTPIFMIMKNLLSLSFVLLLDVASSLCSSPVLSMHRHEETNKRIGRQRHRGKKGTARKWRGTDQKGPKKKGDRCLSIDFYVFPCIELSQERPLFSLSVRVQRRSFYLIGCLG
jgi:hypothetical protein